MNQPGGELSSTVSTFGWLPSPLPPGVCVLLSASGDPSAPDARGAAVAAAAAVEAAKKANAVHAERLRQEAVAATAAAAEAAAHAKASPVLAELRERRPRAHRVRLAPLPAEAAREQLRADLRAHASLTPGAAQLSPALAQVNSS